MQNGMSALWEGKPVASVGAVSSHTAYGVGVGLRQIVKGVSNTPAAIMEFVQESPTAKVRARRRSAAHRLWASGVTTSPDLLDSFREKNAFCLDEEEKPPRRASHCLVGCFQGVRGRLPLRYGSTKAAAYNY